MVVARRRVGVAVRVWQRPPPTKETRPVNTNFRCYMRLVATSGWFGKLVRRKKFEAGWWRPCIWRGVNESRPVCLSGVGTTTTAKAVKLRRWQTDGNKWVRLKFNYTVELHATLLLRVGWQRLRRRRMRNKFIGSPVGWLSLNWVIWQPQLSRRSERSTTHSLNGELFRGERIIISNKQRWRGWGEEQLIWRQRISFVRWVVGFVYLFIYVVPFTVEL